MREDETERSADQAVPEGLRRAGLERRDCLLCHLDVTGPKALLHLELLLAPFELVCRRAAGLEARELRVDRVDDALDLALRVLALDRGHLCCHRIGQARGLAGGGSFGRYAHDVGLALWLEGHAVAQLLDRERRAQLPPYVRGNPVERGKRKVRGRNALGRFRGIGRGLLRIHARGRLVLSKEQVGSRLVGVVLEQRHSERQGGSADCDCHHELQATPNERAISGEI